MTGRIVAPVIPPSGERPVRGQGTARPVRCLPLAAAPAGPAAFPGDVMYGLGRVDSSGRVGDRSVVAALGWRHGDRLTLTASAGVVIARRDPAGMVIMPARPYLAIPASLRRRCGLRPGEPVLVAVFRAGDMLAAYSLAALDQALRPHLPFPGASAGQP